MNPKKNNQILKRVTFGAAIAELVTGVFALGLSIAANLEGLYWLSWTNILLAGALAGLEDNL